MRKLFGSFFGLLICAYPMILQAIYTYSPPASLVKNSDGSGTAGFVFTAILAGVALVGSFAGTVVGKDR